MKNYWNSLNERERNLLSLMGIVVGLYLLYLLIISPIQNQLEEKRQRLISQQDTLLWMQKLQASGKPAKNLLPLSKNQLPGMISQQLKTANLSRFSYQIEQTGTGDTQLQFEQVPFKTFFVWLKKIHETYQINIKQLHVDKKQRAGTVKLLIVLSAGG